MSRSLRQLCAQNMLASTAGLTFSRWPPASPLWRRVEGHVQPVRHVASPAEPRRRLPVEKWTTAEEEARQWSTNCQGPARLRRPIYRLLYLDLRSTMSENVWATSWYSVTSTESGRLWRHVLWAWLQRISAYDVIQMSVQVRLVL